MADDKKSFWTTLPGILAAIAGILGSIVTLIAILNPSIPAPHVDEFAAFPAEINQSEMTMLKWRVTGSSDTRVTIDHGIGDVSLEGSKEIQLIKSTTYTITAINKKGEKDTAYFPIAVLRKDSSPPLERLVNLADDSAPTITVDWMGRGDYSTISEAINAAEKGARILIKKGVYNEGLKIEKPLEIKGEEGVTIWATGEDTISFKAESGIISNLKIIQNGGGKWYSVDISGGSLELDGCDITSQSLACVAIHGDAYAMLRNNVIHDGKASGIFVYENGQGVIENNDIFGNANAGISIKQGANPAIRGNKIHDGKASGIFVYENGQGVIENNDIFGNANAGIVIKEGGNPTIRSNQINKNGYEAIWIYNKGAGTIEDNDLRENMIGAWDISEDSKDLVKRARNLE